MSCSACAASSLQRFIGSFAASSRAPTTNHARIVPVIGARRQFNTCYGLRVASTDSHDISTLEPPGPIAFDLTSAPSTDRDSGAQHFHLQQHNSSTEFSGLGGLRQGRGQVGKQLMGEAPIHASDNLRFYQEDSKPRATNKAKVPSGQRRGNENVDELRPDKGARVETPRDGKTGGPVPEAYASRRRPQAPPQNTIEDRQLSVQKDFSLKNDGRTKAWSPTGRYARNSTASNDDRGQQREREPWQVQKSVLAEKFGHTGWLPRKRLSPDTLEGIRALHAQYPEKYTTPVLADQFEVSPEAIRRILKSQWRPNDKEEDERRKRWNKRGETIWTEMAEMGVKPPKKWRRKGIGRLSELVARGQYRAPLKWRPRTPSGAQRATTGVAHEPVLFESSKSQVPLADRIS